MLRAGLEALRSWGSLGRTSKLLIAIISKLVQRLGSHAASFGTCFAGSSRRLLLSKFLDALDVAS